MWWGQHARAVGSGPVVVLLAPSRRAPLLSPFVRQRLTMLASKERASDQERLTTLIEAGMVTPSIDRTYPLDRVPEAMRHLEAGNVRGKVAITI